MKKMYKNYITKEKWIDLLSMEDKSFLVAAYAIILDRYPDENGLEHYLSELNNGVHRIEILCQIALSKEANGQYCNLPQIIQFKYSYKKSKIPLIGFLFRERFLQQINKEWSTSNHVILSKIDQAQRYVNEQQRIILAEFDDIRCKLGSLDISIKNSGLKSREYIEGTATAPLITVAQNDIHDLVVNLPLGWPTSRLDNNQASRVCKKLSQQYSTEFFKVQETEKISRVRTPFHPMSEGECVEQIFIASSSDLHSLTLYFYTYMQKNSADVQVELFIAQADEGWNRIIRKIYRGEDIVDGRPLILWLEPKIDQVDGQIFKISVTVVKLPASAMLTVALGETNECTLRMLEAGAANPLSLAFSVNQAPSREVRKMFAYVSGCPGDAFRYRCLHVSEVIAGLGYGVDVFEPDSQDWSILLKNYKVVILHRVAHDASVEKFLSRARGEGVITIFDTDDLVFDPKIVDQIDAYTAMDDEDKALYHNGLIRYNKTLSLCDFVTVSTDRLRDEVNRLWPEKAVSIIRNRVSKAMYEFACAALEVERSLSSEIVVSYFSGSKTHQKDFKTCENALLSILSKHKNVVFLVVGHLTLSDGFDQFSAQIKKISFVAWETLPSIYRGVDINLAPLEYDSAFTESKSELKYLEAALLGIPTIGANLGAYKHTMEHGIDGLLCQTDSEWFAAMEQLILSPQDRVRMGSAARAKVLNQFTTFTNGLSVHKAYSELIQRLKLDFQPKTRVAFILRAPIGKTGGGYKKIFILANYLKKYYDVKVYVEAIAHLSEMSDSEITTYCQENFNFDREDIIVGHEKLLATDVVVATNWPTAPMVSASNLCRVKLYFVQDFEPEFYDIEASEYKAALNTYSLGLGVVIIGSYLANKLTAHGGWCRSIPFAIDMSFLNATPAQNHAEVASCSILFFARPNIPRRNFAEGVKALEMVALKYPNVRIGLYGLDIPVRLPFKYDNLGLKTQEQLAEIMCNTDIHLSYSLTNISTVIYEAMACGCACVEADVEPVRAMVEDGVDCLLAVPTADDTYRTLCYLIQNPSLRYKLGNAARQKAMTLTEENMCANFSYHIKESWLLN